MRAKLSKQTKNRWRRLTLLGLATLMVMLLAAAAGSAGTYMSSCDQPQKAQRLDKAPMLHFERGTLQRDAFSRWTLDGETALVFTRKSVVFDKVTGVQTGELREGRPVLLSGHYVGSSLVVHTCSLLDPYQKTASTIPIDLEAAIASGRVEVITEDFPR
jgi:hypothetical protein